MTSNTSERRAIAPNNEADSAQLNFRPLITAGIVLGLGGGGFFDGIIFHQLLQWHHMFTAIETDMTVAGMEINTLGDGLFHLLDWILTLTGIYLLWRAGQQVNVAWSGWALFGSGLVGFGIFNLVEGVIDHHILQIHHLRSGPNELGWDLSFLAAGVLLILIGTQMIQRAKQSGEGEVGE